MTTETSLARHWHIAAFPPGINFHAARPDACVYGREIESKLLRRRRKSLCSGVGRRVTQFVARRRTSQSHQRQLNTPRSAHRLSCRQRLARVFRLYTLRVIFCRFFSRHHANHINVPRLLMGGATGGVEDIVPPHFWDPGAEGVQMKMIFLVINLHFCTTADNLLRSSYFVQYKWLNFNSPDYNQNLPRHLVSLHIAYCDWCALQFWLSVTHPFNGPFSGTTRVSRYQKGKTSLDLNEATDDGVWGCSSISWTICKQSAHCTLLQTDNHTNTSSLNFYRPDALPDAQPILSKLVIVLLFVSNCMQVIECTNSQQSWQNTNNKTATKQTRWSPELSCKHKQ